MGGSPGEAPPLLGRIKSGRGQHIDMALYDCLVSMHEYAVQCYTLSGGAEVPVQTGHDLPNSTLYGVFTATDGHLVIAAQVDDAWKRLAKRVGNAVFAADTRFHSAAGRNEHRLEILPAVRAWVSTRTVSECLAALDAIDVPCAKVQRIDEVLADPQIIARGMVIEQEHPVLGCRFDELVGQRFDIVVNATSASLRAELPTVDPGVFSADGLAYELAYGKGLTPFLRLARDAGVTHLADGVGMLVEQAAEAFVW